jgi:hypothetical protein
MLPARRPLRRPIPRKQPTEARNPVLPLRNRKFESISLQERVRCELGPQTTAASLLGCRIRLPIPAKPDLPLAPEHLDKTELRYGQNDRAIALNRKNALFAGHDAGAENWACLASLIETCKLSGVGLGSM